jgi:hypothetical protein
MIRVSKLGPIRDTTGSSILDEYKDFLAGVQGVSSIDLAQIQCGCRVRIASRTTTRDFAPEGAAHVGNDVRDATTLCKQKR